MKLSKIYYLLFVAPAVAASSGNDHFNIDVSASSQFTDNASKQLLDSMQIDERQDLYQLGLNSAYRNDWVDLKARYSIVDQQYLENSQPNYTSLVGDLKLELGADYQPAHLKVLHSSETLLNAPDVIDISSNRDERSILTAEPSLAWRPTGADSLIASVRATEVSYDKDSTKDSSTRGLQLVWAHEISKVDKLLLSALSSKTSFDINGSLDYTLDAALLSYAVSLTHLEYELSVGANRVVQDFQGVDFTRPNYNVDIKYNSGVSTFGLTLGRKISDSSSGGGLSSRENPELPLSGTEGLDLIDVTSASIFWTTTAICERCILNVAFEKNNENYEVLSEDSAVTSVRSSFSYRATKSGTLVFSYWRQKRNFESTSLLIDSINTNYEIRYKHAFANSVSLSAFVKKYSRESVDKFASYDEHIGGLTLAYSF